MAMKKLSGKAEEVPPDVQVGDEIYFRHPSGPRSGKVAASGKHGCHVDCGIGDRRKVRWSAFLGHKVRVQTPYEVVDSGEDGAIIEDGNGRKRYIHDPDVTAKPGEGPIRKSLLPLILLFSESSPVVTA